MTRNPLASPDMIGITQGAGAAVVAGIVLGWDGGLGTQALGLLGALTAACSSTCWPGSAAPPATASSWSASVSPGSAPASPTTCWPSGQRFQAQAALGWLVGNLNGRTWEQIGPLAITHGRAGAPGRCCSAGRCASCSSATTSPRASAPGCSIVRLAVLLIAVGLVAFGTAAAGPVAFVALAAPQIAQRLAGTAVAAAGRLGAHRGPDGARRPTSSPGSSSPDTELPVGIVTGVLGAPVLLWLLIRANRAGSGG